MTQEDDSLFFLFSYLCAAMYKALLKPFLFLLQPEQAHHLTVRSLSILTSIPFIKTIFTKWWSFKDDALEKEVMGLKFRNPVGLAAGFDKNAELITPLSTLGFGFIEVGTVTPKAQAGNDQPRSFRLPKDEALINRMGFNNSGIEMMVKRLKTVKRNGVIIGGNIGKNKITPNEQAVNDYKICFEALFPYVDYFAVNVSSPNTPNLRELQGKKPLLHLLNTLQALNQAKQEPKPILLKIAPDLSNEQLNEIAEIILATNLTGVIATNTTINRENLQTDQAIINKIGAGGLSGKPITERSTEVIRLLRKALGQEKVIIGVGGIYNGQSAKDKLAAGANLIQVYSGLVYEGPTLVREICKALV